MELLLATWTLRFALFAAVAVTGVSISAGTPVLESVDRGLAAAVAFSLGGRVLMGFFEPPERRLVRMRKRREELRTKRLKAGAGSAGRRAANSTVSRTA